MKTISHAMWASRADCSRMTLNTYLHDPAKVSPRLRTRIEQAAIDLKITSEHMRVREVPKSFQNRPGKRAMNSGRRHMGSDRHGPNTPSPS